MGTAADQGGAPPAETTASLTGVQIEAINRFPDQNPNPVMRLAGDGRLLYANPASAGILAAWGARVGERPRDEIVAELLVAAEAGRPVELAVGNRTFDLLPVAITDMGFVNVYGTDVTARKAVIQFPDQNPNPVLRITWDGTLVYANRASRSLTDGLGAEVGRPIPADLRDRLLARVGDPSRTPIEVESGGRVYLLLPVDVPAFGFINVYGTDTTATRQLEALHLENERLLLNVLPEPIADRLRAGEKLIADRFDDATLLFADIVEFTRLSSGLSAAELVSMLNDVFSVFDQLVDKYRLEKVKTIGDAYMVVGGIPEPSDDHTVRCGRLALDLARLVDGIDAARRLGIRFRVGMHRGPVVAGVIGTKKFIYDVWGDTVNMASRMESLGVPGRIQVTAAVEETLRDLFTLESRGLVDVKGKGPVPTWFLTG